MNVAESYVAGIRYADCIFERLHHADNTVHVQIGKRYIGRVPYIERQGEAALAALLLGLQGINFPVRGMIQNDFVANMMLAGEFVNPATSRGVRNVYAGLRERTRSPNPNESSAAGDP